jgi:hypothetical protein
MTEQPDAEERRTELTDALVLMQTRTPVRESSIEVVRSFEGGGAKIRFGSELEMWAVLDADGCRRLGEELLAAAEASAE